MLGTCLENVRNTVPLVHNITNYVTVNDVANILLACGGSPIMSDEPEDVEDITSICGGLNINIGTLNQRSIEGMFRAGAKALRTPTISSRLLPRRSAPWVWRARSAGAVWPRATATPPTATASLMPSTIWTVQR